MNILITGGAGYIGSHAVKQLLENTIYNVFVLDNLSTGFQKTLDTLQQIRPFTFMQLDLKEFDKVDSFLEDNNIDCIMHFAASIVVPESVENPLKYYMNNTVNTTNLIKCAEIHGVTKFIFSSTAAVYGEPKSIPKNGLDENYPSEPINPYGMSKLMSENVLRDTANAYEDFKYIIFRYFNVAGADMHYRDDTLHPRIGQSFPNATHLIKVASECAVSKRDKMYIFGNDYDTIDGTGVRDYIHVDDLVSAHISAINFLDNNDSNIFNLGYGKGYSVKEVINVIKKCSGKEFNVEITSRRIGDPGFLIANNSKISEQYQEFYWKPKYTNLELICESALLWERFLLKENNFS